MIRLAIYRARRSRRFIAHGTDTVWFEGGREWSLRVLGVIVFVNVWGTP